MRAGVYWLAHAQSLSRECRKAYSDLLLACGLLTAKTHTQEQMPVLVRRTVEAVVQVELYLPCSHLDMKLHSLLHAPARILAAGSLTAVLCWPFEGNWGQLGKLATNRAAPDKTIMKKSLDREVADLQHARVPELFSSSFKQQVIAHEPRRQLYVPSDISDYVEQGGMQEHAPGTATSRPDVNLSVEELAALLHGYLVSNAEYLELWEQYARHVFSIRCAVTHGPGPATSIMWLMNVTHTCRPPTCCHQRHMPYIACCTHHAQHLRRNRFKVNVHKAVIPLFGRARSVCTLVLLLLALRCANTHAALHDVCCAARCLKRRAAGGTTLALVIG